MYALESSRLSGAMVKTDAQGAWRVDVVVLDALQTRLVLCEGHVCLLLVRLAEVDLLIWGDDIEGDVFGRVLLWIISLDYRQVPEEVQAGAHCWSRSRLQSSSICFGTWLKEDGNHLLNSLCWLERVLDTSFPQH
jgi:hypothetical protein